MPIAPPPCSRKITHRRHTREYTAYIMYLWYLVFAMYIKVCLEACDYAELFFVARMTNRPGD